MRQGEFPTPVALAGDKIVAWVPDEIRQWVADRIFERDARPKDAALPPHPVREYWKQHRAAEAPEESPVSAKPPPIPKTRPRANGRQHVVAARAAPVKAAAPPQKKRRGRPPTLSPEEKAERTRARREADRQFRKLGREALRQAAEAAEREAAAKLKPRPRGRAAQRELE